MTDEPTTEPAAPSAAPSTEAAVAAPQESHREARDERTLGLSRLTAGAVQGIALYLLYRAIDAHAWPATDPYWLAPLLMVFAFVPVLYLQAVGTMRRRTLLLWTGAATIVLAGLAWYDIWRQWTPAGFNAVHGDIAMTFALIAFSVVGLFIAQSLIAAGDAERKLIASYGAYFDASSKLGVQLALAVAFVGVFWGVLWLGAGLFNTINLNFLERLLEKAWFAIPATTLAIAAALHVTDVRAKLVAGIRTVTLTLLSWLLPLMTLIAVGFTLSLPLTGLKFLWATHWATAVLLGVAAALVVLINAALQDGDPAHNRPAVLRYAELIAAVALIPIVLIAADALWLRVVQYGWTVERIVTAATMVVALFYAFGYALAGLLSLRGGVWMQFAGRVNVVTAFVVLAVLLTMFSPLGDPARLAVNAQVARLKAGTVTAMAFDYAYLKAEGGRYGRAALTDLAVGNFGANSDVVHKLAKSTLTGVAVATSKPTRADIVRNVTVYPNTRALPRTMIEQDWAKTGDGAGCLIQPVTPCDAFFADFDGDGNEEIVLVTGSDPYWEGAIYKIGPDNIWRRVASIVGMCRGSLAAWKLGQASMAMPRTVWRNLVIQGVPLHPQPDEPEQAPCPG